jgi:hypothetical protein
MAAKDFAHEYRGAESGCPLTPRPTKMVLPRQGQIKMLSKQHRRSLTCLHTDETSVHIERHTVDKTRAEETSQKNQVGPFRINLSIKSLSHLRLRLWLLKLVPHSFVIRDHGVEGSQWYSLSCR